METKLSENRTLDSDVVLIIVATLFLVVASLCVALIPSSTTALASIRHAEPMPDGAGEEVIIWVGIVSVYGMMLLLGRLLLCFVGAIGFSLGCLFLSLYKIRYSPRKTVRVIGFVALILSVLLLVAVIVMVILIMAGVFNPPLE
jgi:hypothetical protein